jgi:hypothetical protein
VIVSEGIGIEGGLGGFGEGADDDRGLSSLSLRVETAFIPNPPSGTGRFGARAGGEFVVDDLEGAGGVGDWDEAIAALSRSVFDCAVAPFVAGAEGGTGGGETGFDEGCEVQAGQISARDRGEASTFKNSPWRRVVSPVERVQPEHLDRLPVSLLLQSLLVSEPSRL